MYARETLGLPAWQIGWLFGLQTVTTLSTRPIIGVASDRLGRRGVIASGLLLCSGGVLLVFVAGTFEDVLLGVCVYAVGVAVTSGAASAYITDLTHRTTYGAAHGVFGTIYDIGDASGPILGGVLVAAVYFVAATSGSKADLPAEAGSHRSGQEPEARSLESRIRRSAAAPDPSLPSVRRPDRR